MIRSPVIIDVFRCRHFSGVVVQDGAPHGYGWITLQVVCRELFSDPEKPSVSQQLTFYTDNDNLEEMLSDLIRQLHEAREGYYRYKFHNQSN